MQQREVPEIAELQELCSCSSTQLVWASFMLLELVGVNRDTCELWGGNSHGSNNLCHVRRLYSQASDTPLGGKIGVFFWPMRVWLQVEVKMLYFFVLSDTFAPLCEVLGIWHLSTCLWSLLFQTDHSGDPLQHHTKMDSAVRWNTCSLLGSKSCPKWRWLYGWSGSGW